MYSNEYPMQTSKLTSTEQNKQLTQNVSNRRGIFQRRQLISFVVPCTLRLEIVLQYFLTVKTKTRGKNRQEIEPPAIQNPKQGKGRSHRIVPRQSSRYLPQLQLKIHFRKPTAKPILRTYLRAYAKNVSKKDNVQSRPIVKKQVRFDHTYACTDAPIAQKRNNNNQRLNSIVNYIISYL